MTNDNPTEPDNRPAGACQVQHTVRTANEAHPLVMRLRNGAAPISDPNLNDEAADEIERLQEREAFILNVTRDAQQFAGVLAAKVKNLHGTIERRRADNKRVGIRLLSIANRLPNVADCDKPQIELQKIAKNFGA